MTLSSAATPDAIHVLVADSNRMQAQLLASALRRRPEFHVATCQMDILSIHQSIAAKLPSVAVFSLKTSTDVSETVTTLRRIHLSHPELPKVLLADSCDRELVVGAFRSGARGIFSITDSNLRLLSKCLVLFAAG